MSSDALAMDDRGNALVAFHQVDEDHGFDDAPTPLSLVALWDSDRLLLVFNRCRQEWELPGGMIDHGETPRQAAVRELREETGYHLDDLTFAGYALFALGVEQRLEYAAVFTANVTPEDHFTPNDEITAACWWAEPDPLPGRLQILDATIGRLARRDTEPHPRP